MILFFNVFQKNSNMPGKSVSTLKRNLNSYIWPKRDCFESFLENGNHGKVLFIKISKIYKFWHESLSFLSREDLVNSGFEYEVGHTVWIPSFVNVLGNSSILNICCCFLHGRRSWRNQNKYLKFDKSKSRSYQGHI